MRCSLLVFAVNVLLVSGFAAQRKLEGQDACECTALPTVGEYYSTLDTYDFGYDSEGYWDPCGANLAGYGYGYLKAALCGYYGNEDYWDTYVDTYTPLEPCGTEKYLEYAAMFSPGPEASPMADWWAMPSPSPFFEDWFNFEEDFNPFDPSTNWEDVDWSDLYMSASPSPDASPGAGFDWKDFCDHLIMEYGTASPIASPVARRQLDNDTNAQPAAPADPSPSPDYGMDECLMDLPLASPWASPSPGVQLSPEDFFGLIGSLIMESPGPMWSPGAFPSPSPEFDWDNLFGYFGSGYETFFEDWSDKWGFTGGYDSVLSSPYPSPDFDFEDWVAQLEQQVKDELESQPLPEFCGADAPEWCYVGDDCLLDDAIVDDMFGIKRSAKACQVIAGEIDLEDNVFVAPEEPDETELEEIADAPPPAEVYRSTISFERRGVMRPTEREQFKDSFTSNLATTLSASSGSTVNAFDILVLSIIQTPVATTTEAATTEAATSASSRRQLQEDADAEDATTTAAATTAAATTTTLAPLYSVEVLFQIQGEAVERIEEGLAESGGASVDVEALVNNLVEDPTSDLHANSFFAAQGLTTDPPAVADPADPTPAPTNATTTTTATDAPATTASNATVAANELDEPGAAATMHVSVFLTMVAALCTMLSM